MSIRDEIFSVTELAIAQAGFFLVDVEYQPEGGRMLLRFYIDKEGGRISLDDCEMVTRIVERLLSNSELEARLLRNSYVLEVSSPGADRILKNDRELHHFQGRDVVVVLKTPIENKNRWEGILAGSDAQFLQLRDEKGNFISIPRQQVKKVQLHIKI